MHQSIPAAPSPFPPPPGYCRAFARLVIPGVEHLQILCCPVGGDLPTPGPFLIFWHARGFLSEYNYTEDFTGKESRLAHLSGQEKIGDGCKGMFLILCMHFFIACHGQNTSRNRELSTWINVFWLFNQISIDIIWKTSFHIYKSIHNV